MKRLAKTVLIGGRMGAAILGLAGLALLAPDLLSERENGLARAESPPDAPIAEDDPAAQLHGRIDENRPEPFPIEGLYGDKPEDGANPDAAPPDGMQQEALPPGALPPNVLPEEALPGAEPLDTSARFAAVYNVSLGRFNLGNFAISGSVQNGQYNLRGNGKFSVLKGWVFNWQGKIGGAGKATTEGPNPSTYSFSQSDGKYSDRLSIAFGDGFVQSVRIWPKPRAYPGEIKVTKEQVQHVVDPLSAAFLTARSDNPHGDLSVCNEVLPVFDGRARYDLVLKPKKRVMVQNRGAAAYSGPAAVCKVKFVPISGYPRGDPGIAQLRQSNEIEAWMIPLRGTDMYVPYRIIMPTSAGYANVVLTSLRGGAAKRAEAR